MADCLFCKIAAKQIPAKVAYEDDEVIAFDDINPAAPVHVLVVPKKHIATLNDAQPGDAQVLGKLMTAAAQVAADRGIAGSGWRVTVNVGKDAHQLVFHVHLHLMGGRPFGWPPG
ncbi:MAG: histidine triad nucleotide-binding protein [Deltaproteobacteria bacterium]|nr:histidine triad nucleotide-binding protein [Deltaproteobacteria bacterium]